MFRTTAPKEVEARIADAEIIILNKVKISRQHLEAAPSVRLICMVATGTDVVDLQAAKELGVTVCNCQAYGIDSVVQHVFSMMLALHTNLLSLSYVRCKPVAGRRPASSVFSTIRSSNSKARL